MSHGAVENFGAQENWRMPTLSQKSRQNGLPRIYASLPNVGHPPAVGRANKFFLHRILFDSLGGPQATGCYRAVPIDFAGEVHHRGHREKARHGTNQKRIVLQTQ